MKEFIDKLIERLEEKVKVTSLEIIVTGTKDKPYFEIKYKEVGKEDYNIGYSSYDLNIVFDWKDECFEIVNQLAEEHKDDIQTIDVSELLGESEQVKQTNADRIRAMSDEELAEFITKQFCHGIGKKLILDWLQSETE